MFIDADAHIIECADTWSYFPEKLADFRPAEMSFDEGATPPFLQKRPSRGIFIDGQIYRHIIRSDSSTGTTEATRELYDVPARLQDMDALGVDVQVLYPTTLLTEVTRRPEVEIPLCESYNRWLADRCGDSNGRLRWAALLPYHSIPDALREMRRVKEAGAVGIFKRGIECDDRRAGDPYFDPIYELAQELDLPICNHISHPYTGHHNAMTKTQLSIFTSAYTVDAFLSVLMDGVCQRFPSVRFGFVEAAAGWLPYALWLAGFESLFSNQRTDTALESYAQLLEEARIFVTFEQSEDLPYLLSRAGDAHLCLGSDYGHSDRAAIREAHRLVSERADLSEETKARLTGGNARVLYGLA